MAWTYLAELEDSRSPWLPGSGRSFIVKSTDTLRPFCFLGWPDQNCLTHLSGMTSGPCVPSTCRPSISSTAGSPARTSALWELARAWTASDPVSSSKSSDSLANFDRDSFSWRTSQLSLFGGSTAFSWSSMRWGMTHGGRLYQPQRWEPVTCGRDGGFVPTPTAQDYKSPGVSKSRRANIEDRRGIPLSQWFKVTFHMNLFPGFVEWMMGYPLKHTALEDWATQWFRPQRGRPSRASRASESSDPP